MLVDSHCHLDRLDLTGYDGQLQRALEYAKTQDVKHFLCVAIDLETFPELIKIHEVFMELSGILIAHNHHEEGLLFPYIKQIETAHRRKETYGNLFVKTLRKPLTSIEKGHRTQGELLKTMKFLTNGFNFPLKACTNHQVLYHQLREFHDDLIQHIHLEKNMLFPKTLEIELQLLKV